MRQILLYVFLLFVFSVSAEQFRIKGKVVDNNNEPLIGASVYVKGKGANHGTATDIDGNFSIVVEKGEILRFVYVGYHSKEINIWNDSLVIESSNDGEQEVRLICRPQPTRVATPDSLDYKLRKSE